MEKVSAIISEYPEIALILIVVLAVVMLVVAIVCSSRRKKILALTSYEPGKILENSDGDYIVVSANATLINLKSNEKFKVYQILDRIWEDVGKKLSSFYANPFEILLKIYDLRKESDGYSIIVSDKDSNLYRLRTKFLPEDYIVKIQPYKSDEDKD